MQLAVREDRILDVDKMLAELRLEREQLEEAILTLERLARGRGRRRGRPPAWLKDATAAAVAAEAFHSDDAGQAAEPKRRGRPPAAKAKYATNGES
jgi:ATP/maltotriose-dependent transcriptional regulator MalT